MPWAIRADEREDERGADGRRDEDRVGHAAPGVEERPRDEREVDNHQGEDEQVDGQVEGVVADSEERKEHIFPPGGCLGPRSSLKVDAPGDFL